MLSILNDNNDSITETNVVLRLVHENYTSHKVTINVVDKVNNVSKFDTRTKLRVSDAIDDGGCATCGNEKPKILCSCKKQICILLLTSKFAYIRFNKLKILLEICCRMTINVRNKSIKGAIQKRNTHTQKGTYI